MSDAPNVAELGDDTPAAPATPATPAAPVADKTLLNGGDDPDAAVVDDAEPDWRTRIADAMGNDPKDRAWLDRFTSEKNFLKNVPKLRRDFSAARAVVQSGPPEDATPEEIAAYRKAAGVPEKAEGYGIAYPEGMKPTENDKAVLSAYQERMLQRHIPPAYAKEAWQFYLDQQKSLQEAQDEAIKELRLQNVGELRGEWKGRDFVRNVASAKEFLGTLFGDVMDEEQLETMLSARLPNGLPIGDWAPLLKSLASKGREWSDGASDAGDRAASGKSLEDEKNDLVQKSVSGKLTKTEDARLNQIYETLTAREAKQGRGRAASAAA